MKKQTSRILLFLLVLIAMAVSIILGFSGILSQQNRSLPSGFESQADGTPSGFQYHYVNISVVDENENPLKNTWVVLFKGTAAELFGYTDENGKISFQVFPGEYSIQFEKYHYIAASTTITVEDDVEVSQTITFEEETFFGAFPSWTVSLIIGFVVLGLALFNKDSLKIGRLKKPGNWFGSSSNGSWTFIDKQTKIIVYGVSAILLIILIVVVIPNFQTFKDMGIYYVLIGFIALVLLLLEGTNKKYWIAAIGFGRYDEAIGNTALGISFAFIFMGATGFLSQLTTSPYAVPISSFISLFMIVIVATFFEEAFFSGIVAPTLAEKTGIVSSILLTSMFFMVAHGVSYGWMVLPLLNAFLFRILATTVVLYQKSWMGVFFAHLVINALSLFSIMIYS